MSTIKLHIYLFSFNRGLFLQNALHSLLLCAETYSITVIDDNSTDEFTLTVLDSFRSKVNIISPKSGQAEAKHALGGLYANMRYAFEDARARRVPHALFLQDDMQMVRPITKEDLDSATRFFEENTNCAQLHTCFMKKFYQSLDEDKMVKDKSGQAYLRPLDYPGYSGFSDVGLFHVERFHALFGSLRNKEYDNNAFAQQHGIQMGISARPFMMWLPYPTSYRGKGRNFQLRLVEWIGGGGFFPYQQMNVKEINTFLTRSTEYKPYAETWLNCPPLKNVPVWSFAGGLSHLKARGGWRTQLGLFLAKLKSARKKAAPPKKIINDLASPEDIPPVES